MLRLLIQIGVALVTLAVAASPAGTAESVLRAHAELTGSLGSPKA